MTSFVVLVGQEGHDKQVVLSYNIVTRRTSYLVRGVTFFFFFMVSRRGGHRFVVLGSVVAIRWSAKFGDPGCLTKPR